MMKYCCVVHVVGGSFNLFNLQVLDSFGGMLDKKLIIENKIE